MSYLDGTVMAIIVKHSETFKVPPRKYTYCTDCSHWEPIPFHDGGGICLAKPAKRVRRKPVPGFQEYRNYLTRVSKNNCSANLFPTAAFYKDI